LLYFNRIKIGEVKDVDAFIKYLKSNIIEQSPELEGNIMTIAEQLEQRGIKKGEFNLLKHQLKNKFGNAATQHLPALENLSQDELFDLGGRLLYAGKIEDLFGK